ncbi:MAG: AAA family ATPase [Ignavibacteriales bacterium]|nr:AAA family ATPase [Ignavibacteriales bacterium]
MDDNQFDYKGFVSNPKSFLIAPAGYGKTHTIAECLNDNYTIGKQLILTHTHAGVASIKEKIKKINISSRKYNVETIASYAQKYVNAFYCGNDIPEQDNNKLYYTILYEKAAELVNIKPIADIIKLTYSGLFVDEYQDCTKKQHEFILALSDILQTHIVGDYLQGIFKFNDTVDTSNPDEMGDFINNIFKLEVPYRWKKEGNNEALGNSLKDIRDKIEKKERINLGDYLSSIEIVPCEEEDIYDNKKNSNKKVWGLLKEKSVLLIHPENSNIKSRVNINNSFNNCFILLEAIDDKDFYKIAKKMDDLKQNNIEQNIKDILSEFFSGTNTWFNKKGLIRKKKKEDQIAIVPVKDLFEQLKINFNFHVLSVTLNEIKKLAGIKCFRKELFNSLTESLEIAETKNICVFEAMKLLRNTTRRIGRKIYGKCIGTTLLTKGLEFDTVAILNAQKFKCPKNLYVALTRACKRLIIFTDSTTLSPKY